MHMVCCFHNCHKHIRSVLQLPSQVTINSTILDETWYFLNQNWYFLLQKVHLDLEIVDYSWTNSSHDCDPATDWTPHLIVSNATTFIHPVTVTVIFDIQVDQFFLQHICVIGYNTIHLLMVHFNLPLKLQPCYLIRPHRIWWLYHLRSQTRGIVRKLYPLDSVIRQPGWRWYSQNHNTRTSKSKEVKNKTENIFKSYR